VTPKLTDTGKRLTPEQATRIKDAAKNPTFTVNLETGITIIDKTLPHHRVREAAIEHGLPEGRKYAANTTTGEIFFVEYEP
jgi:hypothetical protein